MERIKELVSNRCTYFDLMSALRVMHGNTEFAGALPEFAGMTLSSTGARSRYRTASGVLVIVTAHKPELDDWVLAIELPSGEVVRRQCTVGLER
jgi:hypothetical protein